MSKLSSIVILCFFFLDFKPDVQMELVDEVDYHCCLFCDKIFPSEYELLMHVSAVHQNIMDLESTPKHIEESIEFIQSNDHSTFVEEDEDDIQCNEYLEAINKKVSQMVKYIKVLIV